MEAGQDGGMESPLPHPLPVEKLPFWRSLVANRLVMIGIVAGVMLVPLRLIRGTLTERAERHEEAVREVTASWGGGQNVVGPWLVIPTLDAGRNGGATAWVLGPEELEIAATLAPKELRRGIHEAQVYSAAVDFSGTFGRVRERLTATGGAPLDWARAKVVLALSDTRGLRGPQEFTWQGERVAVEPGLAEMTDWGAGMHGAVVVDPAGDTSFFWKTRIDGSGALSLTPVGDTTVVGMRSESTAPRFEGRYLPDERDVDETGFRAQWRIGHLGRDWNGVWSMKGDGAARVRAAVEGARFGVTLLPGAADYRAVERSIKYGVLFLVAVFGTFFLFEACAGVALHGLNYVMVGAALCLFFLMLLALWEVMRFGGAYALAAGSAVLLVGCYGRAILGGIGKAGGVTILLGTIYGYLYLVLRLEDYSLLAGTGALFVLLAATMFATRRIGTEQPAPAASS